MDYQNKYDELDNIENSLRILIDEIENTEYIEKLQEIMYEAQNEKQKVEEKLQEQYDREEKEMNYQYERSVI